MSERDLTHKAGIYPSTLSQPDVHFRRDFRLLRRQTPMQCSFFAYLLRVFRFVKAKVSSSHEHNPSKIAASISEEQDDLARLSRVFRPM